MYNIGDIVQVISKDPELSDYKYFNLSVGETRFGTVDLEIAESIMVSVNPEDIVLVSEVIK